jgi:hypothetical protein
VDDLAGNAATMKSIVYGVASVVLGTMVYVMVGIALAGIG